MHVRWRARAELMQGHTNVARAVLSEELRVLDDEWREERDEARRAEQVIPLTLTLT